MKKITALCSTLLLAGVSLPALAADGPRLNCDDLKAKVEAKFQAKGVKNYTLEAVDMKADDGGAKSVGTCDGNTKKMLYKRGAAPAAEAKPAAKADAPKADAKPAAKAEAPKAEAKPAAAAAPKAEAKAAAPAPAPKTDAAKPAK